MDAGVDARTGIFVDSLANFSLRFNSVIVIDSGSSFVKAAAVGLSENVAAKALSPIRIVILRQDPHGCGPSAGTDHRDLNKNAYCTV
jgi:hypothetical protein